MNHTPTIRRNEQAIVRVCYAGLDARTLRVEGLRRLRRVIPVDAVFFATVDPATMLFTGSLSEAIPEPAAQAFLANEFFQDDVKTKLWLQTPNPMLGNTSPKDMIRVGRYKKLMQFVSDALREGAGTHGEAPQEKARA